MQTKKSPPILSRIEDYLKNNENKYIADKIGVAPQTVSSWKKRGDMPAVSAIEFAERESLSLDWLLAGRGPMHRDESINLPVNVNESPQDYVLIPRYDIHASAGGGAVVDKERIVEHVSFHLDWFRDMNLQIDKAALIAVMGDSMTPTLNDRDMVLVDLREQNRISTNAIYVINVDGDLLVKRLQKKLNGEVIVISDNPFYQPETIYPGDYERLRVVGRVVWAGRRM